MKSTILFVFLLVCLKSNSQNFWERFQTELNCSPYSRYFNFKRTNEIHVGYELNYNFKSNTGLLFGNSFGLNYKNPFSDYSSKQNYLYFGVKFSLGNSSSNDEKKFELRYKSGYFSNYNELDYSSGLINILEFRTTYSNQSFIGFGIRNYFFQTGRTNWSIYSNFGITL